jgi:hypothetical protein
MGWLEVINNPQIPNSQTFRIGNEELTLGQIREAHVAREREISAREAGVLKSQREVADVFGLFNQEKVMLEAEKEDIRRQRQALEDVAKLNSVSNPDETDDLTKVIRRLDAAEKKIEQREAENKKLATDFTEGAVVLMNALWDRDIDKYGKEIPEGVSKNDLVKMALDRGYVDPKTKIPNVGKAIEALLEPKRREAELKEAEERGAMKERERQAISSVGPSTSGFRLEDVNKGAKKFANLDEAVHAAASDPDIVRMLSGTAPMEDYLKWSGQ